MESILTSIKKLIGTDEYDMNFDIDIIMHINSVFAILTQLGIGPSDGFCIFDEQAKWSDFLSSNKKLNFVKSYMHIRVKLLFDPPLNASLIESMNKIANELEWRITNPIEGETSEEGG